MNKLLGYIQTQAGGGTMKRKLFLYMLLLLFFILLVLASMLSLMGQFKTPKDSLLETCELQQTVFQKNIQTHRNHLSMMNSLFGGPFLRHRELALCAAYGLLFAVGFP